MAALRTLETGSLQDAVAAFIDVEVAETAGRPARETDRLIRVGRTLALRMAEVDSESLVPVMVLRHDLVGEYRRRNQPLLGRVASELAIANATLYASSSNEEGARVIAGAVVSSLGGDAQVHGALPTSRQLFEQALELDQTCEPALLGLGAQWELLGRYDLAVAAFSRLRTSHPDDLEGVLRLGVNLVRLKRFEHGIAALRACLNGKAPDWIEVLASEELGRALVASGKVGQGERVLREAIQRHPREVALHVLLAHVLDLSRRPAEARQVLAAVSGVVAPDTPSPRLLYCRWPSDALAVARAELTVAASSRREVVARVLDVLTETGG